MDIRDPFHHLPELREKIRPSASSSYRTLDHEEIDRKMRAMGAPTNWRRSDEEREATRLAAIGGREKHGIWVFAYGSLTWDPGFHFVEVRSASLTGYSRKFCLKTQLGRGTCENPGLMAALDRGGMCNGLVYRIAGDVLDEETLVLWNREMLMRSYNPTFVPIETPQGRVEALAFVIDPTSPHYMPGLDIDETARRMATARGLFGSCREYLTSLAEQFDAIGIEDEELATLIARVEEFDGAAG